VRKSIMTTMVVTMPWRMHSAARLPIFLWCGLRRVLRLGLRRAMA
jgi:hypothetical protein